MRLAEFRANSQLVEAANKFFAEPIWRIIRDVMRDEHPMNSVPNVVLPEHSDSKKLGRIEGWNLFENTLLSTTILDQPPKPLETTFAPPEANEEEAPEQRKKKRR